MSQVAGRYNITADQGATFARVITWRDNNDALVDLTNYTAQMQVRPLASSSTVALELSTANGRITLGGVAGTITLSVPAATMALEPGQYAYDLNLTAGSVVVKLLAGSFDIRPGVTR